ncbi:hypothetical protein F5880DRAFT_1485141 [Lentinula raphanica]|nr:hypothetical protein F5880DRAFT_1485141 [Lentinula raphanica]
MFNVDDKPSNEGDDKPSNEGDDKPSNECDDTAYHAVSNYEANFYYHGLHGEGNLGPKLLYRSSTDVFSPPSKELPPRTTQLLTVHEHPRLANLWRKILHQAVQLLDAKKINITSIDLARFCWDEQTENGCSKTITSSITIWIGVLPNSTNADAAFNAAQGIINLLKQQDIDDVDFAFRESKVYTLAGPILYAPLHDTHSLKSVIDVLTTALSLPIAGKKTSHRQGTLGFYFKIGHELYGVTARHVLFSDPEGNGPYHYNNSAPKKEVILMGDRAYHDLVATVDHFIRALIELPDVLDGRDVRDVQEDGVEAHRRYLIDVRATLNEFENLMSKLKKDWGDVNNRVIGHVVWSPPINSNNPQRFTQDICVIKLENQKFITNFRGNVIDFGTKIASSKMVQLLHPRQDSPSKFKYPANCLYQLRSILAAVKIGQPNTLTAEGDSVRFAIKHGASTLTTIGCINGFQSFKRNYCSLDQFDSLEVAVYPYNAKSGPFSARGDSGAAIVGTNNDIIALLTGGHTSQKDSLDITYATPMEWLWNSVIKKKYPSAILFFDDLAHN